ncbi:hypothetical protein M3Y94_00836700 [Aphelenchoides besseyi]|nr:hypothetical protein M3Y94_00836700 [Aphelenchoides besseyi]KAI6226963.1 hypothetical protein M3Y95_00676700 [Aphelenchoides besseyi]
MLHHLRMPILSASPSMVNVENLMKETFNNNNLGLTLGLGNNNHLMSAGGNGVGLPEDEYINNLISAVEKRPVLYNVNLLDYKNKNKKGEAFKEVQQEMRAAGCNEQQVQGTYKKWISLKRKFRVEYFKPKSEDSREACCTFPYFDVLMFLVPYCEAYKICKTASKRKAVDDLSGIMKMEEDESDDETYGNYDEETAGQSALDMLFNQKRAKLESLIHAAGNGIGSLTNTTGSDSTDSPPPARSPASSMFLRQNIESPMANTNTSGATSRRSLSNGTANGISNSTNSSANPMSSLFSAQPGDDLSQAMAAAAAALGLTPTTPDDSPNSLFGRLVANEIDKLPPGMHNVVRAQVLLLLAQASSSSPSSVVSATDRILSCLTP